MIKLLMRSLMHLINPSRHVRLEILHQNGAVTRTCAVCGSYWRKDAEPNVRP